jgi:membrane-bound serine protease (ClpP class)
MKFKQRFRPAAALLALGFGAWLVAPAQPSAQGGHVTMLRVQDAIGPATSDYVEKGLGYAREHNSILVVLEIDTPGGLDTAMREIIQAILASPVPVATYVSPHGARAASAGTYILYASHFAAMAPATNLGAATPVSIGGSSPLPLPGGQPETGDAEDSDGDTAENGGSTTSPPPPEPASTSERKAINDAVAYIRSLAERRGRNADWAESAVRSAASLSAEAALANNVIDMIATNVADLLMQIDGRSVVVNDETITLTTSAATLESFTPDWRTQFLAVITNPTVAYMLMLLGIYGLIFEGYNPGAIVPGVVGAISLLLALFAFQILPVNYAGLALILLGAILMTAEFLVPSFGALGFGGVAAFIFGSLILFDTDVPGFAIARPIIAAIAAAAALTLLGIIWFAMRSRVRPVVSGAQQMIGMPGVALADFADEGPARVHGEVWRARSATPITKGQSLTITGIDGLTLYVEPAPRNQMEK